MHMDQGRSGFETSFRDSACAYLGYRAFTALRLSVTLRPRSPLSCPDAISPVVIQHDFPVTQPSELKPGQCLVKMIGTGVCHSDLHISRWDWPIEPVTPLVGGHEGVGEIVAIAAHTEPSPVKLGQRVGIKWIAYSCGDCEQCRQGLEQNCVSAQQSGCTVNGTFSQYVVSWVHVVTPIPEGFDSFAAASVLCAGVTVYRALKYSDARIGHWVVIPGAGGGLGHLGNRLTVRAICGGDGNARRRDRQVVLVCSVALRNDQASTDTGAEKKKLCLELGAEKWVDFKQTPNLVSAIKEACDGLGPHAADRHLSIQRRLYPSGGLLTTWRHIDGSRDPGGREIRDVYLLDRGQGTWAMDGLKGEIAHDARLQNISIKGSYVGNRQDSIEALEIAASGKVKVIYALKGLSDLGQ
ncbi:chaperonin 10-like protein [Boletus edulis]|nr:chaperonin 10-like protein [Boletus edulis]